MAKVLYIQASPRGDRSKSNQTAKAFLESYQQSHPQDEIHTLNLFEMNLPAFDGFALQAKYSIMHGKEHSAQERQAWATVEKIIEEFRNADKYVISLPMWNFGIPYRLKQYIDIIVQPGYTFTVSQKGYEGLINGKPAAVIYARGGSYSKDSGAEAYDMQKPYMELILGFMGFQTVHSIVVEQTLGSDSAQVEAKLQEAIAKARELAGKF